MIRRIPGLKALLGLVGTNTKPLIRRAREAQRRQDWTAAEALWRQATQQYPQQPGYWIQLGNMLNELKRYDEAIAAFRKAGEIDPDLHRVPAGVAGVHERAGRWTDAGEAWNDAIDLLVRKGGNSQTSEDLTHAFAHAMMSARNSGGSIRAQRIVDRATEALSDMRTHPDTLAIRATLLPPGRSPAGAALLRDVLALLSTASGRQLDETPGIAQGDVFQALVEIVPMLEGGRNDPTFLRIATDLYENARLWHETARLAEWQAMLEPGRPEHIVRAFKAAAAGRELGTARRLARLYSRQTGELMLIHQLAELYGSAGEPVRARLLLRFLRRRWPHSRWHACRYILAVASTRSLPLADWLVRQEIAADRRDKELELAYCQAAFAAGHYEEARLRLVDYIRRHDDEEADVLLGYTVANSMGLDAAADHFRSLSARRLQPLGAMMGTAHMAMRQRDLPAALAQWRKIAIIHPSYGNASIETARCAYDMGDVDSALAIAAGHLRDYPNDIGMGEFYAWLLTMSGRYEDAMPVIATVLANAGPNWQAVDLHIICASQLGTLDRDWTRIMAMMPVPDAAEGISRFYHVIRILIAVERRDLAVQALLDHGRAILQAPWIAPYLRSAPPPTANARIDIAEARWDMAASMVRSNFSDRLDAMSDLAVDSLLNRGSARLPTVHIINKFEQPRGGSELHALDLAEQIGRHANVEIWAPEMPHSEFSIRRGVRHIDPTTGMFPRGGTVVFIGVYFNIDRWIRHVRPERIIFLYNTFEAPSLFSRVREAWQHTGVRPELLYCADIMGQETGLPGRFEPSPTDLLQFSPASIPRPAGSPFTIGRHSRDVPEKHGRDDWKVYREISDLGGESHVLGGSCMGGAFPAIPGLRLMKARSTGIPDFLQGLDAYFYRTSTWIEPWGRVVIEAMACSLPVLVHSVGGYAQAVRHEVNGLLFDTTEEAVRLVRRLAEEPELRLRLGQEARQSVCDLLAPAELRRMIAFYLMQDSRVRA